MDRQLPANFPLAWRFPISDDGRRKCIPPRPVSEITAFASFGEAFSKLKAASVSHTQAIASAAISERVHSCPWMRTFDRTTSDIAQFSQHFLVPCAAQLRDTRSIDPRCVPVMEFAMDIRAADPDAVNELGRAVCKLLVSAERTDTCEHGHAVARATYEALASIPKLIGTLLAGVAIDEVAAILGAVAAAHDHRIHGSAKRSRAVLNRTSWRIRVAGEVLRASRPRGAPPSAVERPAWMVLYDAAALLEDESDVPATDICVGAVVALGERVPILSIGVQTTYLTQEQRFCISTKALVENGTHKWSLCDALIPCGFIPIRTKHFVEYLRAVAGYANQCVDRLREPHSYEHANEQRCAWAIVALATAADPRTMFYGWATMRAHQSPPSGRALWTVARSLFGQPGLNAERLAQFMHANVEALSPKRHALVRSRIATLCVATRTPVGIKLLSDPLIAMGVIGADNPEDCCDGCFAIDCLGQSPSGTLEFGTYETGWTEFDMQNDETSTIADAIGREITRVLLGIVESNLSSELSRHRLTSIMRISLLPDNLLARSWKCALKTVYDDLELAAVADSNGGKIGEFASNYDCESTLHAAVFRRRCVRALDDASRCSFRERSSAALVTFLSNDNGNTIAFARTFLSDAVTDQTLVVIEYERRLRQSIAAFVRDAGTVDTTSALSVVRGRRVHQLDLNKTIFLDTASAAALSGSRIQYCSPNAMLEVNSCAVSVVHWTYT